MCFDCVCIDVHAMLFGSLIGGCVVLSHFYNPFIVLFFSLEIIFLLVCAHYTQHRGSFQLPEGYALLGKFSWLGFFLNFWHMIMEFSNPWQNLGCTDTSFLLTYPYMISIVPVSYLIPLKYIPNLFFSQVPIYLGYTCDMTWDIVVTNPWWWEIAQTCKNFLFMCFMYWFQCWKLI